MHCRNAGLLLTLTAIFAAAQPKQDVYIKHVLVSDLPGHAERLDPNLANPWGIASAPSGPFWICDNHSGMVTVYDTSGKGFPEASPLVVTVPPPNGGTPPAAPTGLVFNGTGGFELASGKPAFFIFATEDGTISGWNPQVDVTHAILKVDNSASGAVYKGLALANNGSGNFLYATNFFAGTIDVFDTNFAPASLSGNFVDPNLPAGFAPFGIRNFGGMLFVTYAKQNAEKHDDVAGPGNGFVDIFTPNGSLVQRLISGGTLNSPWGMELAPSGFGALSNTLLVGNFGDGTIHGYSGSTEVGAILEPGGRPMVTLGLWGLLFGNGALGGDAGTLYFTAGIPGPGQIEDHGAFGSIRPQSPNSQGKN
jgi:uncharacterized protein (TIGR03118 family)